ncbi:hypothetical protein [Variovorax sp.]|uniref:hypothetical protein n=1 Tax=Variovorax sp. TaxID=1871043 RepID=UPI002D67BDF0|nr:hypothetical protein [Variovorax sp.]HYP84551.1 hypothetical protein [Variovorax sp.]
MARPTLPSFPAVAIALACAASAGYVLAQAPAPAPAPDANLPAGRDLQGTDGRHNQKIERIHIDDGGTKVDELRVGGETKDITVTPRGNMPQYEVVPRNKTRTNNQGEGDAGGGTGPALWNVLKF